MMDTMKTANQNVLRALARVMAEARAGNIEAVAIVAVSAQGVPEVSFGGEAELMPSANIGLDLLKASFVHRVMAQTEVPTTSVVVPATGRMDG
jgi:hypothetical protein